MPVPRARMTIRDLKAAIGSSSRRLACIGIRSWRFLPPPPRKSQHNQALFGFVGVNFWGSHWIKAKGSRKQDLVDEWHNTLEAWQSSRLVVRIMELTHTLMTTHLPFNTNVLYGAEIDVVIGQSTNIYYSWE